MKCCNCGSSRVTMQKYLPGNSLLDWLRSLPDILRSKVVSSRGHLLRAWGKQYVVCKDCGHISIIQVM